jgi:methionyl aminopeptidase
MLKSHSPDVTLYHDGPYMLQSDQLQRIDLTMNEGFHGDLNETYAVGQIDDDSKTLVRTCREALDAAIKICKPGTLFRDIGKAM